MVEFSDQMRALGTECSEVAELLSRVPFDNLDVPARTAAVVHLVNPTIPVHILTQRVAATAADVIRAYEFLRESLDVAAFVSSSFYHHRLRTQFAAFTVREWLAEPERSLRIMDGEPVLSKTVEIHPSQGTCNYGCAMCLWSDKEALTYEKQQLTVDGLLTVSEWQHLLDELAELGATTVVISGGGEALLNRDLATILAHARALGLRRNVYTTGFNLNRASDDLWTELASSNHVRFSIHATTEKLYSEIVGLPIQVNALRQVTSHIRRLIELRNELRTITQIGAGFVIQPANYDQLDSIAYFAVASKLDFLNIRKDEVDVTDSLTSDQTATLATQVRRIRSAATRGEFDGTTIDFSDELIALANGLALIRRRTSECRAKYFRPTISPFGIVAPCDLKAEPRFAASTFNLGTVKHGTVKPVIVTLAGHNIPDRCAQCMPSSRTGNAIYAKLLDDLRAGFHLYDQPFALR